MLPFQIVPNYKTRFHKTIVISKLKITTTKNFRMHNRAIKLVTLSLTFLICVSGCEPKEENKTTQKTPETKTQTQQQAPSTQSNNPTSEAGKIWTQIENVNMSISKNVNSGKSGHLEEPVGEILAMLKTLPERVPGIETGNLETLKTKVNELRKIGVKMDQYQHANKSEELKSEYKKFDLLLKEIKDLLPA